MTTHIEVLLVVSLPKHGEYLLTRRGDQLALPSAYLGERESTVEVAARLLREHTGLDALINGGGWVNLYAAPLADSCDRKDERGERVISVPYGCFVPERREKENGWFALKEILQGRPLYADHLDILLAVSLRLKRGRWG